MARKERTQFQMDKGIVQLVDQWTQGTGYSRPQFLGDLLLDFVQQLQELRELDDSLFEKGMNEVERSKEIRQYAHNEQISKWAVQYYLQKNIPRALDYVVRPMESSKGPISEEEK